MLLKYGINEDTGDYVTEDEHNEKMLNFNIRWYSDHEKKVLLEWCVTLFINCLTEGTEEEKIAAYDVLYNNYCKKFETPRKISLIPADDGVFTPHGKPLILSWDTG